MDKMMGSGNCAGVSSKGLLASGRHPGPPNLVPDARNPLVRIAPRTRKRLAQVPRRVRPDLRVSNSLLNRLLNRRFSGFWNTGNSRGQELGAVPKCFACISIARSRFSKGERPKQCANTRDLNAQKTSVNRGGYYRERYFFQVHNCSNEVQPGIRNRKSPILEGKAGLPCPGHRAPSILSSHQTGKERAALAARGDTSSWL